MHTVFKDPWNVNTFLATICCCLQLFFLRTYNIVKQPAKQTLQLFLFLLCFVCNLLLAIFMPHFHTFALNGVTCFHLLFNASLAKIFVGHRKTNYQLLENTHESHERRALKKFTDLNCFSFCASALHALTTETLNKLKQHNRLTDCRRA